MVNFTRHVMGRALGGYTNYAKEKGQRLPLLFRFLCLGIMLSGTTNIYAQFWLEPFTTSNVVPTGWVLGTTLDVDNKGQGGIAINGAQPAIGGNPGNSIYQWLYSTGQTDPSFTTATISALPANQVFSFDYKVASNAQPYGAPPAGPGGFNVFVIDGASQIRLDSVKNDGLSASWRTKYYSLAAYAGKSIKIRIEGYYASPSFPDFYQGFDNFKIDAAPTCYPPQTVIATLSSTSPSEAIISWVPPSIGTPAGYEYVVDNAAANPSVAGTLLIGTNATLTGLIPSTIYYLHVRSVCGGTYGNSSWITIPFATHYIASVAWFEGFSTTTLPGGWAIDGNRDDVQPGIYNADGNNYLAAVTSPGGFWDPGKPAQATAINVGPIQAGDKFGFSYKLEMLDGTTPAAGSGNLSVHVSTDFGSTYTPLGNAVDNSGVAGWLSLPEISLAAYTGKYVKIRVEALSTEAWSNYALMVDSFWINSANPALPLQFTKARAYQFNGGIKIDWSTLSEQGIRSFDVEKSTNGTSYAKVAIQNALGNSAGGNYNWFDAAPVQGNNYYRIKITGTDGNVTYSEVIVVALSNGINPAFTLYPNPIKRGAVNVQLKGLARGTYTLKIYNSMAQLVASQKIVHAGGSATETIYASSNLAAGIYKVSLNNGLVQTLVVTQ